MSRLEQPKFAVIQRPDVGKAVPTSPCSGADPGRQAAAASTKQVAGFVKHCSPFPKHCSPGL